MARRSSALKKSLSSSYRYRAPDGRVMASKGSGMIDPASLTSDSDTAASPLELDPRGRIVGRMIDQAWRDVSRLFTDSRDRILYCRDIQAGRNLVPLPEDTFDDEAAESLVAQLPERKQMLLKQTAVLRSRVPRIERIPLGLNQRSRKDADDFESWDDAVVREMLDWGGFVGKLLQDGEAGLLWLPSPADWEGSSDFIDTLTRKPLVRFWRDEKGLTADDPEFSGRIDMRRTARAADDERRDFLARRLPFVCRVLSATDYVPILTRGRARERWRTVGMVIRTYYHRQDLVKMFNQWPALGPSLLQVMDGQSRSSYGLRVPLLEYIGLDADDHPYISYSVGTESDGAEAVIDLYESYGLSRLPARVFWGAHTEDDDPDQRGVPFLDPLAPAILNAENLMTSRLVYMRRTGFPGFGVTPDPNSPEESYLEDGEPREFSLPSGGGVITLPGQVQRLTGGEPSSDARELTALLMGSIRDNSPSEAVFGGSGAESGHQLTLSREYLEVANGMVLDSGLEGYEWCGEIAAELSYTLAEGRWKDGNGDKIPAAATPIYVNIEPPPDAPDTESDAERAVVEFKSRWVAGGVFDVTAVYPKVGNLAETQQVADLHDRGLASFDDVMEARGKTSPVTERAKIDAERILNSPEGMAQIQAFAARLRAQEDETQRNDALASGRLQPGPDGLPTAAVAPEAMQAGMNHGAAPMTGLNMGNPAQSSLAGAVGGAMESASRHSDAALSTQMPGAIP